MALDDLWTSSQREAWGYVQSAYDSGMRTSEALRQYRAGGGAIRTQLWGELWHRQQEGESNWSTLGMYGRKDTIPESMYAIADINYRSKYNIVYKANIRMEDGSILHDQYRTIRTNRRMTLGEIYDAIDDTMLAYAGDYGKSYTEIKSIKFYRKA